MSNILIINAAKKMAHSAGALNDSLAQLAQQTLQEQGHEVAMTHLESAYDLDAEVAKILAADLIIYQMPAWWMGPPWTLKKYFDDVFTHGHGKLYGSDGRTRSDPSKKYGSGGLLQNKHYMLSVTWNAPLAAFEEPGQFFEGKGVDAVYFPVHKANQFLGLKPLPTFMCNDVIKDPHIETDFIRYRAHLLEHVPQLETA
ncbi:NAD(P)H-dependent oxidoreductase [Chitinibacter bivalviorum]|uniref:NAD(P)H-dependent oxidoreductase n=1 Tax=Chitinibacter bivalviorum TaxID=2739434 RepID=A0A7H9BL41_9NEIS|nr:NAD(P)H-dependent oxidoreductase [Chitinibacter bivalviorum]QLG89112.1 NAD(P)H-dependent oxidoreductase [Chitinibacter bivalviorum]